MTTSPKHIHTTIPAKYHDYAKKHNLPWNELITKAIENEMNKDPEIIREKLQRINAAHEQCLKDLKKAEQLEESKKERVKAIHKGLIPA